MLPPVSSNCSSCQLALIYAVVVLAGRAPEGVLLRWSPGSPVLEMGDAICWGGHSMGEKPCFEAGAAAWRAAVRKVETQICGRWHARCAAVPSSWQVGHHVACPFSTAGLEHCLDHCNTFCKAFWRHGSTYHAGCCRA